MADFLTLGEVKSEQPPGYRGTGRGWPYYVDAEPPDSRANQAFMRFLDENGGTGVVHDLERSRELVAAYRDLDPPQSFDIIEVNREGGEPQDGSTLIAYDLSAHLNNSLLGGYLLVPGGLDLSASPEHLPPTDTFWQIRPILRLIRAYFQPQLNRNGLCQEFETAQSCLDCMRALETMVPNLWGGLPFEVIGLWRVDGYLADP